MNIFELFAVITHVACPIAGVVAAKGHGWLGIVTGLCTGLVIGRAIFLASTYICAWIGDKACKTEKLSPLQWLASLAAGFLIPTITMFGSLVLTAFVVKIIMTL